MTHTLTADGIQFDIGPRPILSDIHIKCRTGKITGLLGRNGTGKTCLMRIVYDDLNSSSRSVKVNDIAVRRPYIYPQLMRHLPQFDFIPGTMTLAGVFKDYNLEFSPFEKKFPGTAPNTRIDRLSGGERRLINIYIICCSQTMFALLDEPFTHLSPLQIEKVKTLLEEEKKNKGILITDHQHQHILDISDEVYVLADGRTRLLPPTDASSSYKEYF